jgi:hypothetical protein
MGIFLTEVLNVVAVTVITQKQTGNVLLPAALYVFIRMEV